MEKIPLAPIFNPTFEEFQDFSAYIKKLHNEHAERYGIVKILPPENWKPWKENPRESDSLKKIRIERPYIQTVTKIDSLKGIYEYNSEVIETKRMTIRQFEVNSKTYENSMKPKDHDKVTEDHFWSMVEEEKVHAIYGADIEASLMEQNYAGSWNFSNFLHSTLLKYVSNKLDVPGIANPYLYFGSLYTFFPWHTEDINLYSINFMHYGKRKTWYGVPAEKSSQFEAFCKEACTELYSNCSAPIRHKPLMIVPTYLQANNIDVYKVIQEPGEIVITFPKAYHSGFNDGWNCSEAANFAEEKWVPYGVTASRCDCGEDIPFPLYPYVEKFYPNELLNWIRGCCVIEMPNNDTVQAARMTNVDYDYLDNAGALEYEKTRKEIEDGVLRGRLNGSISLPDKYQNISMRQSVPLSEDKKLTDTADFPESKFETGKISTFDVIELAVSTDTPVDNNKFTAAKNCEGNINRVERRRRRHKELLKKKKEKYGITKMYKLKKK